MGDVGSGVFQERLASVTWLATGLRPVLLGRVDLVLRFNPSLEGGLLLLELVMLRRFSSSAIRASRGAMSAAISSQIASIPPASNAAWTVGRKDLARSDNIW